MRKKIQHRLHSNPSQYTKKDLTRWLTSSHKKYPYTKKAFGDVLYIFGVSGSVAIISDSNEGNLSQYGPSQNRVHIFLLQTPASLHWPPELPIFSMLSLSSHHGTQFASTGLKHYLRFACCPYHPNLDPIWPLLAPASSMEPMLSLSFKHGPYLASTGLVHSLWTPCCPYRHTTDPSSALLAFRVLGGCHAVPIFPPLLLAGLYWPCTSSMDPMVSLTSHHGHYLAYTGV